MNVIIKRCVNLSLVLGMAFMPLKALAMGNAVATGSLESSSALIEPANVERQLNRINDGINLIRINNIILFDMPVSQDAKWAQEVAAAFSLGMQQRVDASAHIQNDPYYSTVMFSNAILGHPTISKLTPAGYKLHHKILTLFKNKQNGYSNKKYALPNLYAMPSLEDAKTFTHFPYEENVELIEVEAISGTLYENAAYATIALLPDALQEEVIEAQESYQNRLNEYVELKAQVVALQAWFKDDNHIAHPKRNAQKEALEIKKEQLKQAQAFANEQEAIFFEILQKAALAIETNFDVSKIELAQKLDALFESIDTAAMDAITLFSTATMHLSKNGFASLSDELKAITAAAGIVSIAKQENFLKQRYQRVASNAVYAFANITMGTYYAYKQVRLVGKYQQIVDKMIEGAKALE